MKEAIKDIACFAVLVAATFGVMALTEMFSDGYIEGLEYMVKSVLCLFPILVVAYITDQSLNEK